jgi:hypothetical protein
LPITIRIVYIISNTEHIVLHPSKWRLLQNGKLSNQQIIKLLSAIDSFLHISCLLNYPIQLEYLSTVLQTAYHNQRLKAIGIDLYI